MAKKYQHRTHVSIRKKQEEQRKLEKRRAFYAKYKNHTECRCTFVHRISTLITYSASAPFLYRRH